MKTGTVLFFNDRTGFGFIEPDRGLADVFVDTAAVERAGMTTLRQGQRVSFDLVEDPHRGENTAHNLKVL